MYRTSVLLSLLMLAGTQTFALAATATAPAIAGDGRVSVFEPSNSGCNLNGWRNARLATSGDVDDTSPTRTTFVGGGCLGYSSMAIARGFLVFDTSAIPANATITGAQLSLYVTGKRSNGDGEDFVSVVQGLQQATDSLSAVDYMLAGNNLTGATEGSNRVGIAGLSINSYKQWTLNAAGLSWIVKGGKTKLALRVGNDLLDTVPSGSGNLISAALSESGAGTAPYLTITYTTTGMPGLPGSGTTADLSGPAVALTLASQTVTGPVALSASASDLSGVAGVVFMVDGAAVGAEDTVAPYTLTWDSAAVANGQHQITAVARDALNNVTASTAVTVTVSNAVAAGGTIQLNSGITHQTISGWETTAEAGDANSNYLLYRDTLLQQAVNDLGINRIRLEWKNTTGTTIDYATLDAKVSSLINPMRSLVQQNKEKLLVNLCYVGFNNNGNTYRTSPSAYAAAIVAVFRHLQSKFGWTPDYAEVALEPDTPSMNWSGAQVAANLAAAGDALAAAGFRPKFVAPSTTSCPTSRSYFDAITQNAKALNYLTEVSYHRYVNCDQKTTASVASRAASFNKQTSMLELMGATDQTLHRDLKFGNVSAWQQYTLAFGSNDTGGQYYTITGTSNPQVGLGSRSKRLRQYFRFIRSGAVRIDAQSGNSTFDPVAFRNANGKHVVVVQASAGGSFSIAGLPAGMYGITYTTPTQYDVNPANVIIGSGQALKASIPSAGVITVYQR